MTHHLHDLKVHDHRFEHFSNGRMQITLPGEVWYSWVDPDDFKRKAIEVGQFWREVAEYIENTER
jgi:hypothetical protein